MTSAIDVEIMKLRIRERCMDSAVTLMKTHHPGFKETIETLETIHGEIVQAIKDAEIDANTLPFPEK